MNTTVMAMRSRLLYTIIKNSYSSSYYYYLYTQDGYAPFCKHLFIPNFASVKCGYTKITEENKSLIESCYEARTEKELAVLIQVLFFLYSIYSI